MDSSDIDYEESNRDPFQLQTFRRHSTEANQWMENEIIKPRIQILHPIPHRKSFTKKLARNRNSINNILDKSGKDNIVQLKIKEKVNKFPNNRLEKIKRDLISLLLKSKTRYKKEDIFRVFNTTKIRTKLPVSFVRRSHGNLNEEKENKSFAGRVSTQHKLVSIELTQNGKKLNFSELRSKIWNEVFSF